MNGLIKKAMVSVVVPALIVAAALVVPLFTVSFDTSTLSTIVSLLFAVLVGFFIATSTSNYLKLQTLITEEDSGLIALYNLGILVQPNAKKRLQSAIDVYVIDALNYELESYIELTDDSFSKLLNVLDKIRPVDQKGLTVFSYLQQRKLELLKTRQEISLVSRRIITPIHWATIVTLAVILGILLFILRDGSVTAALVTGLLACATYFTLVIVYQIDSNVFIEEKLSYENSQRVFRAIGALNYYPVRAIAEHRAHPKVRRYRVGRFVTKRGKPTLEIQVI